MRRTQPNTGSWKEPEQNPKNGRGDKEYVERAAIWMDDGGQMLDPGNMMAGSNSKLSGAVR